MAFKVLIVDDSSFFRRRVTDILNQDKDLEVIGTAVNGKEAVEKAVSLRPDVITMDVEMPVMDGITSVREIMKSAPIPILMFSSLTHKGAKATFDALDAGALDFLPKKFEDIARDKNEARATLQQRVKEIARKRTFYARKPQYTDTDHRLSNKSLKDQHAKKTQLGAARSATDDLRDRLAGRREGQSLEPTFRAATRHEVKKKEFRRSDINQRASTDNKSRFTVKCESSVPRTTGVNGPQSAFSSHTSTSSTGDEAMPQSVRAIGDFQLLAIGTSTGGPVALQKILMDLPRDYSKPIVLIQHMPAAFTAAFAARLDTLCQIRVKEAQNGDVLQAGVAYLAPGGQQMMIEGSATNATLKVKEENSVRINYKPSVDITFGTAARVFHDKVLAIILTGMGADGRDGARMLKNQGSRIWAQNEASSVIYGMPQAVTNAGLSECSLHLDEIAARILKESGYG